ncbi:adenine nucleotide alpha hydrolase [Fulvivirgaceae bacterium PWU5]|uniref:Adenine nucleotide alpha hydrolase n=1 Tax=Dawidia cretensis TaxID=2782350 RepID=A0AAP2E1P6_9BACT|nr:adenine nucleotide alpha hydrolase [Dawidia cretensis]MBT1709894.1 adenine nucleotide alpha hydrolase [Dawidia cretensis]
MQQGKQNVTISWSGGKDAAFALHKILATGLYNVVHLHTVIGASTRRVGLHGVREELIDEQATCLGMPLHKLYLPESPDHGAYETLMQDFYRECTAAGIKAVVFGDIFLEDLRAYREAMLHAVGLKGIYPLWAIPSEKLLHDFLAAGYKTVLCSASASWFMPGRLGVTIDNTFAASLPAGVDCCGENGEFHTLVYDGPLFQKPLSFRAGEVVKRSYTFQKVSATGEPEPSSLDFWFRDLVPL